MSGESQERIQIANEIYSHSNGQFPDIRQYKTRREIRHRKNIVQRELETMTGERDTRAKKRLKRELQFLTYKSLLYGDSSKLPEKNLMLPTKILLLKVDKSSARIIPEEEAELDERLKRCQTVMLLLMTHLKIPLDRLRKMHRKLTLVC